MLTELLSQIMGFLVLLINFDLVSVFLFKSATQVLSKLLLLSDFMFMWLQVRKSLMKLAHKDTVICLSEVSVVVASELVVAINHMADSAHHPFYTIHRTDAVSITVHDSDWGGRDILDRDVSSHSVLFPLQVRISVLLEPSLNTHLEVVGESTG